MASKLSTAILEGAVQHLVDVQGIEVISQSAYEQFEPAARRRVPRDPNDWAPVAVAMALDTGILTEDNDFLGCGCPPGRSRCFRWCWGSHKRGTDDSGDQPSCCAHGIP